MTKHFLFPILLLSIGLLFADGRNLAYNGDFSKVILGKPVGWLLQPSPYATFELTGGPAGQPYVALRQGMDDAFENSLRLKLLSLVPGERYRLSASVRTKDFAARRCEFVLVNTPWYNSVGMKSFPSSTNGWQRLETEVICPELKSPDGYDVLLLVIGQRGLLDITDIRLEALTERGERESRTPYQNWFSGRETVRLVPWGRSFNEIPLGKPLASFVLFGGSLERFEAEDHCVRAVVPERQFASPQIPIRPGVPFELDLSGLPMGRHVVTVQVVSDDQKTVHEEKFTVTLRELPTEQEVTKGKRLNNFTVELFNRPVKAKETVPFSLAGGTWLYVTLKTADGKVMSLSLDGHPLPEVDSLTGLPEAFRYVEGGTHTLETGKDGTLVVRTISEMFSCGMNQGSTLESMGRFDWEFARKWALKAVTTLNRGSFVPQGAELVEACHKSGRIWMEDMFIAHKNIQVERIRSIFEQQIARLDTRDGNTINEIDYAMPSMALKHTTALKTSKYDSSKLMYTWTGGMPYIPEIHQDFIGTALNASHGRGKILYETYHVTRPTEAEARSAVMEGLLPGVLSASQFYPGYVHRSGVILGNFNQLHVITAEHHPQVDYKYYLDMQLNILANHPAFEGLGCVGYWGTHFGDEELYRWSHELLRHYVVEGKRTMLSERYGFRYLPGHIENNDFDNGLSGWKAEPAEPGSLAVASHRRYGMDNQGRWMCPAGCGDHFCTFKVTAGKANTLSQRMRNLIPGKKYMLLFSVGDLDDTRARRLNPRKLGLKATIQNAEICETLIDVDKRKNGNYSHNSNIARLNLHRILFIPKATECTLTFSDAEAKSGETLQLNYIQVKPFFDRK